VQNLDEALQATRKLVREYLCHLGAGTSRVFFTGHKGFNIEVRPQAIGITSTSNRQQEFDCRLKDIKKEFGDNFVDRRHRYLRLRDSINRWISNDGKISNRMKFELTPDELNSMSIHEICRKSEKLASSFLRGV
jgi:hypothetical protein